MKRRAHTYAIECMSHRLAKFGFEPSVNKLDARSLIYLSTVVHAPMNQACLDEAFARDASLRELFITQDAAA